MSGDARERLRSEVVANLLGISGSTLAKWRKRRIGPTPHRNGPRIIYYLRSEVEAHLKQCDTTDARGDKAPQAPAGPLPGGSGAS